MGDLLPNQIYFLKWSMHGVRGRSLLVLKGEFVKYLDNRYREDYINYISHGEDPSPQLFGSILTNQGEPIVNYPFDHPLYPYQYFWNVTRYHANVGLFRITGIKTCIDWGIESTIRTSLYIRSLLAMGVFIKNTPVIEEGTLMWVDLDQTAVIPANRILEENAIKSTGLPYDMEDEIYGFLGVRQRRDRRGGSRRRGKSKSSIRSRGRNNTRRVRK